jgi:ribosomal protein S12 methylthiotransferase
LRGELWSSKPPMLGLREGPAGIIVSDHPAMSTAVRTLFMVSLGCPKNRVDSEVMLGVATARGLKIVSDPALAQVIVVNTCGFINDAKRESIDVVFEMAAYKQTGVCNQLIVTGCLAQRHHSELGAQIPEIDVLLGSGDVLRLGEALDGKARRISVGRSPGYLMHASHPRLVSTPGASAYVKIAEGCDRRCAFCVIPQLRGSHRSRPINDIVREVKQLADRGVLEVNLVSQDTTAYGRDLGSGGRSRLAELVQHVAESAPVRWVRLMYLYPDALDDALVDLLANHPRVLPYVDMPMQHASDHVLRAMRRGHTNARLRRTVQQMRGRIAGLTLRTAFIVGFPGETEQDFKQLCDFVQWAKFERVGVFRYSDEQDASSFRLPDKVGARTSYDRARRLMALQRPVAREANRRLVDTTIEVLVEGPSPEHDWVMVGRHGGQAPEIDGTVYFSGSEVQPGQLWQARVLKATDYDLVVETLGEAPIAAQRARPATAKRRLPVVRS